MARKLSVVINGKEYVSTESKKAQSSLDKLKATTISVNKVIATSLVGALAAASAAVVGLSVAVKKAADSGDRIDKLSQQLGLSRKTFQELDYVMTQTGTEIEGLRIGVKALFTALEQAERGSSKYEGALKSLNVSLKDSNGDYRDKEAILTDVMLALADVNNETERTILANNLLGRSAQTLEPLFNAGSDAIREMMNDARDLGLILSDDSINAAVKWTDAMDRIKRAFSVFRDEAMTPFMTMFADVADRILPTLTSMLSQFSTNIKEFGSSSGFNDLTTAMSEMIIEGITFAQFFPKIMIAGINDIKQSWDDLWSGKKMTAKMDLFSQNMINVMSGTMDVIFGIINNSFKLISSIMGELVVRFINGIIGAMQYLVDGVTNLINTTINPLISLINLVKKEDLPKSAISIELGTIDQVPFENLFKDFSDDMGTVFTQFTNKIEQVTEGSIISNDSTAAVMSEYQKTLENSLELLRKTSAGGRTSNSGGEPQIQAPAGSDQNALTAADDAREQAFKDNSPAGKIVGVINDVVGGIANFGGSLGPLIGSLSSFQAIMDPIGQILAGVMDVLGPLIDSILQPIVGILRILGRTLGSILAPTFMMLGKVIEWLAEGFVWFYNKAIMPTGNFLIEMYTAVGNFLIKIINGVITALNHIPFVNIGKVGSIDSSSSMLTAIDMASLTEAGGGASGSSYTGGGTGSSTSVQSVNITVNQTFNGNVIGDGGLEDVGEFVVSAIRAYAGVGGNVGVISA